MKTQPLFTKEQICKMFNCTEQRLNNQYAANAATLNGMRKKAQRTNKKVNGYTEGQLTELTDTYTELAKPLSRKERIAAAPKFGLYIAGAGWLANQQGLTGVNFTQDKAQAMQYAQGFDNPADKLGIWDAAAKRVFGPAVKFEIVKL